MTYKTHKRLAQGLGLFSIGLGLVEVFEPDAVAELVGVRKRNRFWFRLFGIREMAAGILILGKSRPAAGLWSRVAGDAIDLGALGAAYSRRFSDKDRLTFAIASVGAVGALDLYCAVRLSRESGYSQTRLHTVTINRPPEEVYRFWRNFENLPKMMSHLKSVEVTDPKRSHWVAKAPAGKQLEWDAEIIEDKPNQLIAWRSLKGSDVDNRGHVYFREAPGGRGTEIHAQIEYNPPGGAFGAAIASLFGEEPGRQMKGDLYRFKQMMETGEVVHSDASIHKGMHPGQPPGPAVERSESL